MYSQTVQKSQVWKLKTAYENPSMWDKSQCEISFNKENWHKLYENFNKKNLLCYLSKMKSF